MPATLKPTKCSPSDPPALPPSLSLENGTGMVASVFTSPFDDFSNTKENLSLLTNNAFETYASPRSSLNEKNSLPPSIDHKSQRPIPDNVRLPGPFVYLHKIQSGSFGDAIAVRELNSPRILCMKVLHKKAAIAQEQLLGIVQEVLAYRTIARSKTQEILEGGAFLMELEASLQDERYLYFIMEIMDCDLLAVYNGYRYLRHENARRWLCQISLGLAALHSSGIIHRDIKPENLLLDLEGNIRITDFGTAHTIITKEPTPLQPNRKYSHQLWGTDIYMAPEMLANRGKPREQRQRYGLAVDYWALGCVAFELLSDESIVPEALFAEAESLESYLEWDEKGQRTPYPAFANLVGVDAEALVTGLLSVIPRERFRIDALRSHPFFRNPDGSSEFQRVIQSQKPLRHQALLSDVRTSQDARPFISVSYNPPEVDDTFCDFGWINPQGIWGQK